MLRLSCPCCSQAGGAALTARITARCPTAPPWHVLLLCWQQKQHCPPSLFSPPRQEELSPHLQSKAMPSRHHTPQENQQSQHRLQRLLQTLGGCLSTPWKPAFPAAAKAAVNINPANTEEEGGTSLEGPMMLTTTTAKRHNHNAQQTRHDSKTLARSIRKQAAVLLAAAEPSFSGSPLQEPSQAVQLKDCAPFITKKHRKKL